MLEYLHTSIERHFDKERMIKVDGDHSVPKSFGLKRLQKSSKINFLWYLSGYFSFIVHTKSI